MDFFQQLLCGNQKPIDSGDWIQNIDNTIKYGDKQYKYLEDWIKKQNNDKLLRLFTFATGKIAVPVLGFNTLQPKFRFKVDANADVKGFPLARTCFNELVIPPYNSFELFSSQLELALEHAESGLNRL